MDKVPENKAMRFSSIILRPSGNPDNPVEVLGIPDNKQGDGTPMQPTKSKGLGRLVKALYGGTREPIRQRYDDESPGKPTTRPR